MNTQMSQNSGHRAKEIKDIEIIELSTDKIIADVRGFSVYTDVEAVYTA
ncbi:MAG: hypothetical protein J5U17_07350 [Candidatus Methanoperedens sp.]|nr:hypothetical protein [Candidatus Methanoperedens sp.]MCE8429533.1 hypothetical protein [Candidatus Methanoperedens sp.]